MTSAAEDETRTSPRPYEVVLAGVGTAILLTLAFPPWDRGVAGWFALTPLLYVLPRLSWRVVEWLGFLTGLAFYAFNFRWFHAIFGFPAVALWAILALFLAVFCALVRSLPPEMAMWKRVLLIACFWVAVEFVRCEQWPLRFSWLALGYGLRQPLVLPLAGVIGVYGLSFLAAAASAWGTRRGGAVAVMLLLFVYLVGMTGLEQNRSSPRVPFSAMAVQSASPSVAEQKRLSDRAFAEGHHPALVVWPEYTVQQTPEEAPEVYAEIERWAKARSTTLVFGSLSPRGGEKYSSAAYVVGPDGKRLGTYEKHDPLPFFRDGEPGSTYPVFPLEASGQSLPFGVTICFDLSFERNARRLVANGARFLVVPSEEPAEWPRLEQMQHALIAPMRAAENGVGILRASAPGPSQSVDSDGAVWRSLPVGEDGVMFSSPSAPAAGRTFYNRAGWLIPWICQGVTLLWLFRLAVRWHERRPLCRVVHGPLFLAIVSLCLPAHAHGPVRLTDGHRTVTVDPATLQVTSAPGGELSDAGPASTVRALAVRGRMARWEMPERGASVVVALAGDTLDVTFRPHGPGSLTFPRLGASAQRRALVLPIGEGAYVPTADAWWARYMPEHGPEDTLEGLTMPFVGVDLGGRTATYVFTNRFHNRLEFLDAGGRTGLNVTHRTEERPPHREWTVRIVLGGPSPMEPARLYRRWLKDHGMFVSMRDKIVRTPDTAKLLGAAQVYLWGGDILSRQDVTDWPAFCRRLMDADAPVVAKMRAAISPEAREAARKIAVGDWPDRYATGLIAADISEMMARPDFTGPAPAIDDAPRTTMEIARRNSRAVYAVFAPLMEPPERWGDGVSVKMMDRLHAAGLNRLWLGLDSWRGALNHPDAIRRAEALGYLVAPYDSYNSIHALGATDTWETAQFDERLYRTGPVVRANGTKQPGFQQKGYILNAAAAFPYVKRRVLGLAAAVRFNSWFLDTDAFGQLYDDYSPLHPGTRADDMRARIRRMEWIRDALRVPVGAEGGSAYAAPYLAYEQGVTVPTFGWGDADLKDRNSPYFLGAYYPPGGPAVFLRPVPLKDEYVRAFYDPRFRLPLYETVFHDSVVTTRHWSAGSLKFTNVAAMGELSDLLYQTPPLYHWNLETFAAQKDRVAAFMEVFTPLHEATGRLPMTAFEWLTPDRLVQRTRFGSEVEITVNFGDTSWREAARPLPPRTAEAHWLKTGERVRYTPQPDATAAP